MLEYRLSAHFLSKVSEAVGPLIQVWLVYLEDISGKHHLGPFSRSGDDGLYLMRGKVLGLVYDEIALSETPAPDVRKRLYYKFFLCEHALDTKGLSRIGLL